MSTTPNERETAAKSLDDDDDVVVEMIRECVQKNQCYSCGEASVGNAASGNTFVDDEKIVNDECAYTFASPIVLSQSDEKEKSSHGIFVNMKTRRAVSRKYLRVDSRKTNRQGLYVERRFRKVFDDVTKVEKEEKEEEKKVPLRNWA